MTAPRLSWNLVLAVVCPPVAVALSHEADQLLLNIVLTICFWVPGAIHAVWIVSRRPKLAHYSDGQFAAALHHHLRR